MTLFAASAEGLVIDASVALKLVIQEEGSEAAAALMDGRPLYAPGLMRIEAANALWSMVRRGRVPLAGAADAFDLLLRLPLSPTPAGVELTAEALRLAALFDHPVYDCVYLSLAAAVRRPVITADRGFLAAARRQPETSPVVTALAPEI